MFVSYHCLLIYQVIKHVNDIHVAPCYGLHSALTQHAADQPQVPIVVLGSCECICDPSDCIDTAFQLLAFQYYFYTHESVDEDKYDVMRSSSQDLMN